MKNVKIPSDRKPVFSCKINGKTYEYPAGATVSVPDEVAELIESIEAQKPKPRHYDPPAPELPRPAAGDDGKVPKANGSGYQLEDDSDKELPDATGKTGKFLKAGEEGPEWGDVPDCAPFATDAVIDQSGEVPTVSLYHPDTTPPVAVTAAELFEEMTSGKELQITAEVDPGVVMTNVVQVISSKLQTGETVMYQFEYANIGGSLTNTGDDYLAGDAAVVFKLVV